MRAHLSRVFPVGLTVAVVTTGCGADESKRELADRKVGNLTRCLEARGVSEASEALEDPRAPGARLEATAGSSVPPAVVSFSTETPRGPLTVYAIWRDTPRPDLRDVLSAPERYAFVGLAESGSATEREATEKCLE